MRGNRRSRSLTPGRGRKILASIALLTFILSCSLLGAYLNHVRGDGDYIQHDDDYWYHHIFSRIAVAVPTAVIMAICAGSWKPLPIVAALTTCSLFIGWGCYYNVAFDKTGYPARSGVFDWLIGRQEQDWSTGRIFAHNFAGMALRGLAWTAPQGYILFHLGYGWQHAVSGALMSTVYALGYVMPSAGHMTKGTNWSEYIWGYWIWAVGISASLASLMEQLKEKYHKGPSKQTSSYLSVYIMNRSLAILFEVWCAALSLVFICSTIWYSFVQQKDVRNKGQTFFGMFTVSTSMFVAQMLVYASIWLTRQKDIDLTYELRTVAILCRSPLILRNRVYFSTRRFIRSVAAASRDRDAVGGSDAGAPYSNGISRGTSPNAEQHRTLPFESSAVSSSSRPAPAETFEADDSDSSEGGEIDWDEAFSTDTAGSPHVQYIIQVVPYKVWLLADEFLFTSLPAVLSLVLGVISLLACLITGSLVIVAAFWNLTAPRFLDVCECSQ
ncbi:uncharacterized protein LOC135823184 [Sycon ciliatum]|uniref:uncharacterized protein LOC135823184 n=1 Tax=Sycon ciliatum TaxID=27933 RepID=UPI0020AB1618|eukprot:scpid66664/ scgid29187/ 